MSQNEMCKECDRYKECDINESYPDCFSQTRYSKNKSKDFKITADNVDSIVAVVKGEG